MAKKDKVAAAAEGNVMSGDAGASTAPAETAAPVTVYTHGKKLPLVGTYTPESKITWLINKNPRMPGRGTYDRFQKYLGTETVKAYTEAGGTKGDLLWDLRSGFLEIDGVTLGGPLVPRKPRQPPKPKEKKVKVEKVVGDTGEAVAAAEKDLQEEVVD